MPKAPLHKLLCKCARRECILEALNNYFSRLYRFLKYDQDQFFFEIKCESKKRVASLWAH